ncbi:MAG: hypothetical protein BWY19_00699 [bacterium ADurb.Bin212]|nr:MAG: hypothetical protein BWY19_00699 [bacterium ADurb.Bin212]
MTRGGEKFAIKLLFAVFLLAIDCCLFCSDKAFAAQNNLVINEIFPSPSSGEKEWVEIYNYGELPLDLSKFQLKDGAGTAKDLSSTERFIEAGEYYVFEINSGWLNNSGEIIYLVERSSQTILDRVAYGDWDKETLPDVYLFSPDNNAPVATSGKSISRIPNGTDTNIDKNDFRPVASSPGNENVMPVFSKDIKINEIVPTPADGAINEYVELINLGGETIDLCGWVLDDIEGGSSPYLIADGISIAPFGYVTFYNWQSGITLNDSGDSARLYDPNGEERDKVEFIKGNRGQSYSSIDGLWRWTTTLTPSSSNILTLEPESINEDPPNTVITIKQARGSQIGSTVLIEGYVTAAPGILGKQIFYIQDLSGGVQVYNYWAKFPLLKTGQFVRVLGEMAANAGEIRLKTISELDIIVLQEVQDQDPQRVSLYDLNDDLVGTYIKIQGTVKSTSGENFVVSGSPEIAVSIRKSTKIDKPKMAKGDKVEISGILSVYNSKYRILPFDVEGVKILSSGVLPLTGFNKEAKWNLFQRVRSKPRFLYANLPRRFQLAIPY